MWHATCTQGNRVESRLLVVGSQIANLTPDPSFDHNLCFRCPNGSCEHILDIYIPRAFQWYRNASIQWVLTPTNALWKFGSSHGLQLPKWEFPWECEGSFPHILLHSREYEMWLLGFLLALILASPCLGCEPNARVATKVNLYMMRVLHRLLKNKLKWGYCTKRRKIKNTQWGYCIEK
jgi:hypothetical protein